MAETSGISRRSEDLAVVVAEDRVTVLDFNVLERPPLILEGTAMAIWTLLDGTRDRAAIVDVLAQQYDVPADEVSVGVDAFLRDLTELGLLVDGARSEEHG